MASQLEKDLQAEVEKLQNVGKEISKLNSSRQQLQTQFLENQSVKKELDLAADEDVVFKLIGPALVKQDLAEACANVAKRIEYIGEEMKRHDGRLKALHDEEDALREKAMNLKAKLDKQTQDAATVNK